MYLDGYIENDVSFANSTDRKMNSHFIQSDHGFLARY